jgi:hypothetical protein
MLTMDARARKSRIGQLGGELDIERKGSTPAEIDERREAGRENDVTVPVLQARWASIALASMVTSFLLAVFAIGKDALFVVWFVGSVATFIWWVLAVRRWLRQESIELWIGELVERGTGPALILGVILLTLIIGVGASALLGGLVWCLWRVAVLVAPEIVLPWWLEWSADAWRLFGPLVAAILAIASASFWVHIELAFSQKLAQKSVFQEQNIWGAVGSLLAGNEPPWWWAVRNKRASAAQAAPREIHLTITTRDANGRLISEHSHDDCPLDDDTMIQLARYILTTKKFSETACCSSGAGILSQKEYQDVCEWMFGKGFAKWTNPKAHKQGVDITAEGADFLNLVAPEPKTVTTPPATPPHTAN